MVVGGLGGVGGPGGVGRPGGWGSRLEQQEAAEEERYKNELLKQKEVSPLLKGGRGVL